MHPSAVFLTFFRLWIATNKSRAAAASTSASWSAKLLCLRFLP